MFPGPNLPGGGGGCPQRARSLTLRQRQAPVCRAHKDSTRARSHATASSSSTPASSRSSSLLLQGALGVGIGVGLGLGFSVGVSNLLVENQDPVIATSSMDPKERDLVAKQKGNAFQSALSSLARKLKSSSKNRQVTDVLIQLNCLTFFLQKASKGWISAWGCKHNQAIASGQLWRLATPALLHGNLLHLLVNCYTLNHLGPTTEALFGGKRMLAVYVLSGVSGNVFSYYMNHLPAVGCSGALFGLLGALGYFYYRHSNVLKKEHVERPLRSLNNMLISNLVIGLTTPNIDNWAHMGGLFGKFSRGMSLSLPPKGFPLGFPEGPLSPALGKGSVPFPRNGSRNPLRGKPAGTPYGGKGTHTFSALTLKSH